MADPPKTQPSRTTTTFLTLPRELRQKIIHEAYNALRINCIPSAAPRVLPFARRMMRAFPPGHGDLDITRASCIEFLKAIKIFTASLKEAHEDIAEDVEYVIMKLGWFKDSAAIIEELGGLVGELGYTRDGFDRIRSMGWIRGRTMAEYNF
ncbi:hypothetical protein BLS_000207 [Venturia inaequalis]|uniref:Uncharacterized protein n=1 Tax=Venturia inaequalis TaxID=5025 RepID=A0A8H3U370_VENIN|nr:hypothetical protein BLS_000207 [Venturia inaequalis]